MQLTHCEMKSIGGPLKSYMVTGLTRVQNSIPHIRSDVTGGRMRWAGPGDVRFRRCCSSVFGSPGFSVKPSGSTKARAQEPRPCDSAPARTAKTDARDVNSTVDPRAGTHGGLRAGTWEDAGFSIYINSSLLESRVAVHKLGPLKPSSRSESRLGCSHPALPLRASPGQDFRHLSRFAEWWIFYLKIDYFLSFVTFAVNFKRRDHVLCSVWFGSRDKMHYYTDIRDKKERETLKAGSRRKGVQGSGKSIDMWCNMRQTVWRRILEDRSFFIFKWSARLGRVINVRFCWEKYLIMTKFKLLNLEKTSKRVFKNSKYQGTRVVCFDSESRQRAWMIPLCVSVQKIIDNFGPKLHFWPS